MIYEPEKTVTGPAYGAGFKTTATIITVALFGYGANIALRFPLPQFGLGVKALLIGGSALLLLSYYWFLRSQTTIDAKGIRQTWMFDKRVAWSDIRSAKMIGIPHASWLFPPRLVVRTGVSFVTFNGGSQEVLIEFAKISIATQAKK
jgi:hypothetical protein